MADDLDCLRTPAAIRPERVRAILLNPYLLLTLAALFWSGNVVVASLLGHDGIHHVPPATLNALRWGIALAAPQLRGRWPIVRSKAPCLALLGVISVAGYHPPFYAAMSTVPALDGGLVLGAGPAVILALAVLARKSRTSGVTCTAPLSSSHLEVFESM